MKGDVVAYLNYNPKFENIFKLKHEKAIVESNSLVFCKINIKKIEQTFCFDELDKVLNKYREKILIF
jgi:hypothetical protein